MNSDSQMNFNQNFYIDSKLLTNDLSASFYRNDYSDGYHPNQWVERAQSIQLASSPDRPSSRCHSPLSSSSPLHSSPIFSPPPKLVNCNIFDYLPNYETPKSLKRGRPRNEDISNLILCGSSSRSNIKCNVCNRVFPREKSLQAHKRIHTGERPYKCNFLGCDKAFAQSGQLRTHQRLHTGEKPFICNVKGCDQRFTHPNRRCPIHPVAGVRRFLPCLSVLKQQPENKKSLKKIRKTKETEKNKIDVQQAQSQIPTVITKVDNDKALSVCPLESNNGMLVSNNQLQDNSLASEPAKPLCIDVALNNRNDSINGANNNNATNLPMTRKSVINHVGRASRKLDAELAAVSPTTITSVISSPIENSTRLDNDNENNPEFLGALALMELAGAFRKRKRELSSMFFLQNKNNNNNNNNNNYNYNYSKIMPNCFNENCTELFFEKPRRVLQTINMN